MNKPFHTALWALVLVCCSGSLVAATGVTVVSFTRATHYTDNTPINSADIAGYAVDCTVTPIGGAAAACLPSIANFPATSSGGPVTVTYPAGGARVCFRLRTLLVSGVSSAQSELLERSCVDFSALTPRAPGNVTVTIQIQISP